MKINSIKIIVSIFMVMLVQELTAQENEFCKNPDPAIFTSVTLNGWVKFRSTTGLTAGNLFTEKKAAFGFSDKEKMILQKTITDELGITHTWWQQYYNDLPVLFGLFILHEKNGQLQSGNGKIYNTKKNIPPVFSVTPLKSINIALQYLMANKYWWQDTAKENTLKRKLKTNSATYYPKAEPIFYFDTKNNIIRPAYKLLVQCFDPGKSGYVYIDGINGAVFLWDPVEKSTCDPASVNTVWYNSRTIFTYTDAFTSGWDLEDDCTPSTYKVYDYSTATNSIFNSGNNTWTGARERSAATCLWGVRQTRNVYSSELGRNGHDDNGGNLDMYFDYIFANNSRDNASYHYDAIGDDEMNIGTGSTTAIEDDYGTLDILAHEFTHGVTRYTANFVYQRESGALDESFADAMAEFVENRVFNGNNWLMGWDRIENGNNAPIRNFENPQYYNQPDRYMGKWWKDATNNCTPVGPGNPGNNDWCGVHSNSGVQNRMYYLLSIGGNGWTNDSTSRLTFSTGLNPYPWNVTAIGINKAASIAYRALRFYLGSNSNYFDSRNAWVHAAEDMYGACSFEAIQTGKAWYAIGIGPPVAAGGNVCGTYGNVPFTYSKPGQINVASGCTVNVLTTGNTVQVNSGSKITINPGFTSPIGSRFVAHIVDDCIFTSY